MLQETTEYARFMHDRKLLFELLQKLEQIEHQRSVVCRDLMGMRGLSGWLKRWRLLAKSDADLENSRKMRACIKNMLEQYYKVERSVKCNSGDLAVEVLKKMIADFTPCISLFKNQYHGDVSLCLIITKANFLIEAIRRRICFESQKA